MRPFMLAACWYIVPGVLWMVASDLLLGQAIRDPDRLTQALALKDVVFVLITGVVVYRLLARQRDAHRVVEAAAADTERSFQQLFKHSPLPIWAYDRETLHYLEINDVALAKYGYERDELMAMKVTDLHPSDELPALRAVIRRPREVREYSGRWHHRLKSGRLINVEVEVHDLELRGRPARVVVALDVTERTRMLERQNRNAIRARALADAAVAINLAGTLDEMLGAAAEAARSVIGAHVGMTVLFSDLADVPERTVTATSEEYAPWAATRPALADAGLRQLMRQQNQPIRRSARELRRELMTGADASCADSAPPMRGWLAAPLVTRAGANIGLMQISDRVEDSGAEDAAEIQFTDEDEAILVQLAQMTSAAAENARLLQEGVDRERRYRELVEGLQAIVWEASLPFQRFTFVSHQAESILGYPSATWLSADDMFDRCLSSADRQRVRTYLTNIVEGRHAIPCEVLARASTGVMVWLRIEGAAHLNEAGTVTHLRGLITDVTGERDQAEREARGEKLRALGQLSSGVAHDLNQSLAMIAGYGELLQQALDEPAVGSERVREMADVIVRAASDGGETVRRMLTFAQSPQDEPVVPVDLPSVVHEVVRLTAPRWRDASQAEARPIEVTVEIEGDATIQGRAGPLREALTNLVLNAVDALPNGGLIRLEVGATEDRATVAVSDNGVGMSDDVRARIFEPFFTTKGDRGTGLGLPSVFGIVEAHGGDVSVRSDPGVGTRFELHFPLVTRSSAELQPTVPADVPTVSGSGSISRRCLVVDDEPQLVRMLAMILTNAGYDALQAGSGEEALELLAIEPVDLLITDVGMGPAMNGWELVERVRVQYPDLPIMLATGWGATIDTESARERGVCAILSKPYRRADLNAALARVPWRKPDLP